MIVVYGIIIFPLSQYFRELDPTLLSPFYSNDAVFNGFASRRAVQLKILMARGTDRGYFRDPSKSLFIADSPDQEAAEKWEFKAEGLHLNVLVSFIEVVG